MTGDFSSARRFHVAPAPRTNHSVHKAELPRMPAGNLVDANSLSRRVLIGSHSKLGSYFLPLPMADSRRLSPSVEPFPFPDQVGISVVHLTWPGGSQPPGLNPSSLTFHNILKSRSSSGFLHWHVYCCYSAASTADANNKRHNHQGGDHGRI